MAENNDFNLVISDEENMTLPSNRTLQNTLSPPASQQFIRRAGAGSNNHQDSQSQNRITSPHVTDSLTSYGHEFQTAQKQEMNFPPENFLSPNSNWQGTFGSPSSFDPESHKKNQFVKKSKRTNDEGFVDDEQYEQRMHHEADFSSAPGHYGADNRRYNEDEYGHENDRMIKTASDRFEGDDYGEYGAMEGSQELDDDEMRKAQSLRDSQLSGPLRYSKMSEEEAARAFENRKKELFSTYLKKGPTPKRSTSKPSSPGGDARKVNRAEVQQQQEDVLQGRNAANGFVIYNNKNTKTQNPQQTAKFKATGRENSDKVLNVKRVPSPMRKKESTTPVARQRKDSPMARNSTQQKQPVKTPVNQQAAAKTNQAQNRWGTQNTYQSSGKVNVDLKKSSRQKENQNRDYYFQNIQEVNETSESQQDRQQRAAEQPESHNVYFMNKMKNKNNDILHDIHDLDEEIYRLEKETGIRTNSRGPNRNDTTDDERTPKQGGQSRGRPDSTDRFSHNQKQNQQGGWKPTREKTRSRSLQRDDHNKAQDDREKRQRINELQAEKGQQRYTESSRDSIKDQIYQSYAVLNERGYEHHYDYLYERAMVQRKCKDLLHERTKEVKDSEEAMQCTFAPQINAKYNMRKPDIITQTKNWQLQKEKQLQANEKHKMERELEGCTFYPNGMLEKDERFGFNANDFYKRNIEWQKRKEADDMRKQNEIYKSMTTAPERKKSHGSLSVSRVHDSQIISPTNAMNNSRGLTRNSSNKSLRSARDTKAERSQSAKKRDDSEKRRSSVKGRASATKTDKKRSPLREKALPTQQSGNVDSKDSKADPSKSLNSLHLQSQIMESYAILDGLQHMLSAKEKDRQEKIIRGKENVDKKLKTIKLPQEENINLNKPTARGTQGKGRATASPRKSPARTSVRPPNNAGAGYEVKPAEEFVQNIVVRNNRYFIEERPLEKAERAQMTRASRERSRSIESRKSKRGFSPAKEYKPADMRGGSYVAASQAKKRKESPYKSKPIPKHFETSASKSNYSDIRASPLHSGLNSPQSMGMFNTGPSPRYELNYVTKGLISPTTHALEKKYLDLLSQVSRVTKQLEHVSVENSHLQEDITTIQKRQINSHPLYS